MLAILLTFLQLVKLILSFNALQDIARETNQYTMVEDKTKNIQGGLQWEECTISNLKAYLASWLYMGIKWQLEYQK
jgi:hypothetical protein